MKKINLLDKAVYLTFILEYFVYEYIHSEVVKKNS
jgi:hypothetical protein